MENVASKYALSLFISIILFFSTSAHAGKNLTKFFSQIYNQKQTLTTEEITVLRQNEIIFIPGILAESLNSNDERARLKLTLLLSGYYETQLNLLNNKYNITAKKLKTSSKDINETKKNIQQAAQDAQNNGKKVIFISHSLGGLVLLDELTRSKDLQNKVSGVIFLQSPFQGTELAALVQNPPYYLEKILHPLLPWVNVSQETLTYITPSSRKEFMNNYSEDIQKLIESIPLFTFSSISNSSKSLLLPLIDLNKFGCIKSPANLLCITPTVFKGPYDESDGLIPRRSSFIKGADYIYVDNVDHVELVMPTYSEKYEKEQFTTTILKMLAKKINSKSQR